jgi:hypothetical protein
MPECEIYRLSLRPKENPSRIPTRWPYHVRVFSPMNVRATVSRWCTLPSVIGVSHRCPGRRSVSIWRLRVVLARIQWHNCVKRRLETFLLFDSCRNDPVSTAEAILIKICGRMLLHNRYDGMIHSIAGDFKVLFPISVEYFISVRHLNRSKEFYCLSASSDGKRAVWRRDATWGRWLCVYVTNLSCRDTRFWPRDRSTGTEICNIQAFYSRIASSPK